MAAKATEPKILVLNGPNLDMLGVREPDVYGCETLESVEEQVREYAGRFGIATDFKQSNSEGELIDILHAAPASYAGIVYNPGAHTHYSYALRDAVASINVPVVEVHISKIDEREPFRRVSVIAPACVAQVKGLGLAGYCRAIDVFRENAALVRLGEGYEANFPEGQAVIVGVPDAELRAAHAAHAAPAAQCEPEEAAVQAALEEPAAQIEPEEQVEGVAEGAHAAQAEELLEQPAEQIDASSAQAALEYAVVGLAASELQAADSAEAAEGAEAEPAAEAASVAEAADSAPVFESPAQDGPSAGLVSYERQMTLQEACTRMGLDAFLVRDTSSIAWLSALDGVFDEERAHALLVKPDGSLLHTDSRYSNALRKAATAASSDIVVSDTRKSHARFAADALASGAIPFSGTMGIEDTVTYAEFIQLAEEFGTDCLVPTKDVVVGLRAVKDKDEIVRLRAAQAITDAAFAHIVGFIKPGMTERQVQLELEHFMLSHGAQELAFRSIVASGANSADPHAVPSDAVLQAGQCIVLDFGAKAAGYCSDMTRMVFLGQPDDRLEDAYRVLREANETVERALAPGMTGREAHELAEKVLANGGYEGRMGHGLGHGVGIDVHEQPVLNMRNEQPLVAGNVVTVEPGIYLPGEFGMRLEDFGVITETGFDVFTQTPHDMVIV